MDQKGKQKIGYILWALAAIAMIMLFSFYSIRLKNKVREEQIHELTVIYPDIKDAVKDNFSFYQVYINYTELGTAAAMAFLVIVSGSFLILYGKRDKEKILAEISNEFDLIYEQLLRFSKGDFGILRSISESNADGKQGNIHEKLRELSYYFSDLKSRLTEEENNTKALITNISHQLKTPLASIRMCNELVKSSELSENERKEFLAIEAQEIEKLEVLLDELLKLSQLERNMIQIKPEKNSLKQTISEAVSQIFMKAYAKNIEICADMDGDVEISHDRKWTTEALANILDNAVKYSEPDTSINIRVSCLPSSVLIEIEDEGMGIQEDEVHKIFKRFYRGSMARELVREGAGVGLYLARNIIEQQGGAITAKRKTGNGTIFKIILPS